jgi:transcriptional regulator with XRE-family HTH domain
VSIGDSLAEARRQAGLTIAQVSQQTRIRESIIRGIEQGDFSACGGDFYARGHIRSIATVIGLDPVPLIREYDVEHGPLGAMRAADVFEPSTPIKIRERRSPSLSLIVVVVLLAIIGYSVYHLVSSHGSGRPASAAARASGGARPKSTPKPHPAPSPTPTPTDVVIHLAAVENCWVQLTSSMDGSQIYMGTIPAGSSMTWTEMQAVKVTLGNPGGIVLTVDGKRQAPGTTLPVTLSFSPGTIPQSSEPPG